MVDWMSSRLRFAVTGFFFDGLAGDQLATGYDAGLADAAGAIEAELNFQSALCTLHLVELLRCHSP